MEERWENHFPEVCAGKRAVCWEKPAHVFSSPYPAKMHKAGSRRADVLQAHHMAMAKMVPSKQRGQQNESWPTLISTKTWVPPNPLVSIAALALSCSHQLLLSLDQVLGWLVHILQAHIAVQERCRRRRARLSPCRSGPRIVAAALGRGSREEQAATVLTAGWE